MPEFIAPLLPEYSIQIPQSAISLVGWLVWLVVLVGIAVRNRDRQFVLDRASLAWLALLSVLLLIFTPFLGVPIKTTGSVGAPHLMFLAALPWMAAGGLLGMVPSVLLAGLSGVLLAYLDTHSIFTPLFFMSIAVVFTLAIRQKQQGFLYRLLRIPPVAALAAGAVMFPLTFLGLFLGSEGALAASMVSSLNQFLPVYLSLVGMALLGGCGLPGGKAGDWRAMGWFDGFSGKRINQEELGAALCADCPATGYCTAGSYRGWSMEIRPRIRTTVNRGRNDHSRTVCG